LVANIHWSISEDEILRSLYVDGSKEEILNQLFSRTWRAIQCRAARLGLKRSLSLIMRRRYSTPKNHPFYGRNHTEETKRKLSELAKERFSGHPERHPFFGKRHKTETLRKMSLALKGKIPWNKGKPRLEETKRKMSETKKRFYREGRTTSWNKGKEMPSIKGAKNPAKRLEVRGKISEVNRDRWKDQSYSNRVRKRILKSLMETPTKPERKLIDMLERNGFPFKYVGDGSFMLNSLNPDFIEVNGKKIIEVFGRRYHDPEDTFREQIPYNQTEIGRKAIFGEYGWDCLIFWEDELDNEAEVIRRINEFIA